MPEHAEQSDSQSTHGVAELVFLAAGLVRLLRRRWVIVLAVVALAVVAAAVHYGTAPRIYESRATVLVSPRGTDAGERGSQPARLADVMPTYVKLFASRVVLAQAAQTLAKTPHVAQDWKKHPTHEWPEKIKEQLTARGVRRTHLIELSYRSGSPQAAHATLEALIGSYLDFIDRHHRGMAVEVAALLDRERQDVRRQIESKQQQLRDIRQRLSALGLMDRPDAVHPIVARVMAVNEALIETRSRRLELEAQRTALDQALREGRDLGPLLLKIEPLVGRELMLSALGLDAYSGESNRAVEQQLLAAQAELKSLSDYLGPAHPRVRQLQQQIAEHQRFLAQAGPTAASLAARDPTKLGPLLSSLLAERLVSLKVQEQKLSEAYQVAEQEAARLQDQWGELQLVQHDLDLLRNLHDTLVNRLAQLDLTREQAEVRMAVVNPPALPLRPVSPRAASLFPMALCVGLLVGLLAAYAADLLDDRFRSPDQIEQQLGLPLLAVIGQLETTPEAGVDRIAARRRDPSRDAESFRTLRTTLHFTAKDVDSLAVTSPEPGDGKTTVLIHLAASLAHAGQRILVIDADMRKPAMTRVCQLRGRRGLVELLSGSSDPAAFRETVCHLEQLQVDVLPSGRKTCEAAELLQTETFVQLLAWAESQYDLVLVDCPPVVAASDAAIVGHRVDGTMVVVQPGKNKRRLVTRSIQRLRALSVPLVGVVANRVTRASGDEYGEYGYGYGYGYDSDGQDEEPSAPHILKLPENRAA